MNTIEKTKKNVFLSSLSFVLLLFIVGNVFLNYQFDKVVDEKVESISHSAKKLFNLNIRRYDEILKNKLNKITSLDGLAEAIVNKDTKKIDEIIRNEYLFEKHLNKNLNILSFINSDGTIIYRAHKPEIYGDKVDYKNSLIVDTNKVRKSFSGFEKDNVSEITYAVTEPIFYKNKYIGSVEIGVLPIGFIEDLKTILEIKTKITINKESDTSTKLLEDNKVVFKIDLKNHNSELVGNLFVTFDISDLKKSYTNLIYLLLFVGLIISLLIVFVTKKSFDSVLNHFKEQAYTDSLTSLGNRHLLDGSLVEDKLNVLIVGNIKEFSLINELYGINIGNMVLKRIGDEFKTFADEYSMKAYRISSDEFALLKYDDSFLEDEYLEILEELLDRIKSLQINIEEFCDILQIEMYFGISNGNSNLVEKAQMALKKAKEKSLHYMAY
ncbi:MAG: diguanylate cyclase, partial [Thiovulaceae bacterium]|nr:diguanylate cyclase [Sulfurimonadaceae bacterium]